MRVIGYLRVSTDEQARSGLGLDAQSATVQAEADRRGWEHVEWVTDEGVSGGTAPCDRDGLGQVLATIGSGDVVIVAKLDRLSRSALDFLDLADRAESEGWSLIVLDLGLDMTTPMGRFTATILAAVAELERQLIAARTREALASLKAQGQRLGRPVELPDDVRHRIADARERGDTFQAIADRLNDEEVPTARGGTWHSATVLKVCRSVALDREAEEAAA